MSYHDYSGFFCYRSFLVTKDYINRERRRVYHKMENRNINTGMKKIKLNVVLKDFK